MPFYNAGSVSSTNSALALLAHFWRKRLFPIVFLIQFSRTAGRKTFFIIKIFLHRLRSLLQSKRSFYLLSVLNETLIVFRVAEKFSWFIVIIGRDDTTCYVFRSNHFCAVNCLRHEEKVGKRKKENFLGNFDVNFIGVKRKNGRKGEARREL